MGGTGRSKFKVSLNKTADTWTEHLIFLLILFVDKIHTEAGKKEDEREEGKEERDEEGMEGGRVKS